jgi:hypothetical protein
VIGGQQLSDVGSNGSYIISFVPAAQVPNVAKAIHPIDKDRFRLAYFDLPNTPSKPSGLLAFLKTRPRRYEYPISEEDFEYTWDYFEEVQKFYYRAASTGFSTVFCVDQ